MWRPNWAVAAGAQLRTWAKRIKRDVHALYLAARDRRTPWYAKALALAIAAYALSPIDLIPDFVPVLCYLDDVILLPLAMVVAVRLIPADVMAEHRAAAMTAEGRLTSRVAGAIVIGVWFLSALLLLAWLKPDLAH